ncbi:MAG: thioredoxin family protein [Candidatus Methylomirabilales bacterium]
MAISSTMELPIGAKAPDFSLPNIDGKIISLKDFADAPTLLVMFICNHCPYVQHLREHLAQLVKEYQTKGVAVVGINSNDVKRYPDDAPDKMTEAAKRYGFTFPYLLDESQEVAKAYRAACTPDFFLLDKQRKLIYRGQYDDSRPNNDIPVTGKDLRTALDASLADRPIPQDQVPSLGCGIKWKPGNEPDYFKS